MYDPWPMRDQRSDKKATSGNICFDFFRLKFEPEILNFQILSAVLSRTTNTYYFYQIATSSSIVRVLEELNEEGSDTVFHA